MFWFFGQEACGILALQPGIEPVPPELKGKEIIVSLMSTSNQKTRLCSLLKTETVIQEKAPGQSFPE